MSDFKAKMHKIRFSLGLCLDTTAGAYSTLSHPIAVFNGACFLDKIKTWTGLPVEESIRLREDRDKWRKYVNGVANPRIEDG